MAWSIADARWILGRDDLTSFLIWVAFAAAAWGYLSSRLPLAPWQAQVLGAAVGAIVLIEAVGSVLPGAKPGLWGWFNATADSVTQAYLDLTWRRQIATTQVGHFCLILGIFVWGTAQSASYAVFGYHRPINAVLLLAAILLANMVVTYNDQFWALVLFSGLALALLARVHSAEERSGLQRHRIWRGSDFRAPRSENGMAFASLAIAAALILTSVASSAPLADAWPGLRDNFNEFATWVSNYLPAGGQSRVPSGADFGASKTIGSTFHATSDVVVTLSAPDSPTNAHWRVVAYDSFHKISWEISPGPPATNIAAGDPIDAGTLDDVGDAVGRVQFTYTVYVKDHSLKHAIIASEPASANVRLTRILVGTTPEATDVVWFGVAADTYTITSLVPDLDPKGLGLTQWRLRHAGTDFDPELLSRYTQGTGLVGADAKALLAEIVTWGRGSGYAIDPKTGYFANEYDAADAIQAYLRDPGHFTYDTNLTNLVDKCAGLSTADCFAKYKHGFCEQYATTMTMLMRMQGFPARYVEGYLAGHVDQASRQEQLTGQQRHAWVEVYFPGYGWIPFDPTGGSIGAPTNLPAGQPVAATPTPGPSSSGAAGSPGGVPHRTVFEPSTPPSGSGHTDGGPTGLIVPGLISLAGLLAIAALWTRRPRRPETPAAVYTGIVKLAARLGYSPSPTQTVFEYTGMLAEIVPKAREPLAEVAMAHVEVVYGRREPTPDGLVALAGAKRAVRSALIRLLLRLPGRRPNPSRRKAARRPRTDGRLR